ncbi:MAG: hypothetical protein ABMA64_10340 [Myxococcota bacterium]
MLLRAVIVGLSFASMAGSESAPAPVSQDEAVYSMEDERPKCPVLCTSTEETYPTFGHCNAACPAGTCVITDCD